jgi:hypothetical protein
MASGTSKSARRRSAAAAKRANARERLAAVRAAEQRRARRRRIIIWVSGGVVAALAAGGGWVAMSSADESKGRPPAPRPVAKVAAAAGTALPPWPRPDDTAARAQAAGLSVAPMEGTARHFHTHLDVFVDGRQVPVPAELGIAASGNEMAELHTHDTTGVLHIEAPTTSKRYALGQLFTEWNVRLDATDLGGLRADATRTLTAYVDGKKQTGDPASIELAPHREIALVYGAASAKVQVPSRYTFPAGE